MFKNEKVTERERKRERESGERGGERERSNWMFASGNCRIRILSPSQRGQDVNLHPNVRGWLPDHPLQLVTSDLKDGACQATSRTD